MSFLEFIAYPRVHRERTWKTSAQNPGEMAGRSVSHTTIRTKLLSVCTSFFAACEGVHHGGATGEQNSAPATEISHTHPDPSIVARNLIRSSKNSVSKRQRKEQIQYRGGIRNILPTKLRFWMTPTSASTTSSP
jgi:hypothetical protein